MDTRFKALTKIYANHLGLAMDCATASTTMTDAGLMEETAAREMTRLVCIVMVIGANVM